LFRTDMDWVFSVVAAKLKLIISLSLID